MKFAFLNENSILSLMQAHRIYQLYFQALLDEFVHHQSLELYIFDILS